MNTIDAVFSLINIAFYLIERSDLSREEKDKLNEKIREKFNSLPPPSTLKDTWPDA